MSPLRAYLIYKWSTNRQCREKSYMLVLFYVYWISSRVIVWFFSFFNYDNFWWLFHQSSRIIFKLSAAETVVVPTESFISSFLIQQYLFVIAIATYILVATRVSSSIHLCSLRTSRLLVVFPCKTSVARCLQCYSTLRISCVLFRNSFSGFWF